MATPIWKNTSYNFNEDILQYTIVNGNSELFSGKAYKYPNATGGEILLNKICENYLDNDITFDLTQPTYESQNFGACKTFALKVNGITRTTVEFYWNYSYNDDVNPSVSLNRPINGKYTNGMYKMITQYAGGEIHTNMDSTTTPKYGYNTLSCGNYALYYRNRLGGFDAFLISGKVSEKDSYNTSSYVKFVKNQVSPTERENNVYRNEITHSYEISTGWLKDSESKILAENLLSSTKVYLHDLVNNKIIPVDIQETEIEYKNFLNLRKLVSYTINIKESNKKVIL